jgi:hypothetical protein
VQRPERDLTLAAAACRSVADGTLEGARPELVASHAAVGAMLERGPRDGVRRVVDDHHDRDVGRSGAQPGLAE